MIAGLGHILLNLKAHQHLPRWLSYLPLTVDFTEGPAVYGTLCTLTTQQVKPLLGANMANIPKIVSLLINALNTRYCIDETTQQIVAFVAQLGNMKAALCAALSQEDKEKFLLVLAGGMQAVPQLKNSEPEDEYDEDDEQYYNDGSMIDYEGLGMSMQEIKQ
jgi:hypothetical protein